MHIKSRVFLTCALLIVAACSTALSSTPCYAVGNIHIIIVRSTTDEALNKSGGIWMSRLENMLKNDPRAVYSNKLDVFGALEAAKNPGGLGRGDVATYLVLQNEESTHPESIMKACLKVSEDAGPDDAIVVFIQSHGSTPKGITDGILRHAFAPIATNRGDLELIKNGILRKTILDSLTHELVNGEPKPKSHRLVALISDSCGNRSSIARSESPTRGLQAIPPAPSEPVAPELEPATVSKETSYFKKFLEEAHGVVNINSCGYGQIVSGISSRSNESNNEDSAASEFEGSLFINAFNRFARNGQYLESELNPDDFYKLLRIEHAREVLSFNQKHPLSTQINDLTRFNDEGSPITADPFPWTTPKQFKAYYEERREMLKNSGELKVVPRTPLADSGEEPIAVVGGDEAVAPDAEEATVDAVVGGVIEPERAVEETATVVGGDE